MSAGLTLNPPAADSPGRKAEEEGGEESSCLLSKQGAAGALPCTVPPTFQGQDMRPAMGLLDNTLLESSALFLALSLARIGCARVMSRDLMIESFKSYARWNWKHP